jgi:hypothetical protein
MVNPQSATASARQIALIGYAPPGIKESKPKAQNGPVPLKPVNSVDHQGLQVD